MRRWRRSYRGRTGFRGVVGRDVLAGLPNRPVSRDQVKLMQKDNVVSAQGLTLAALGIEPTPVEAILPTYLG